MDVTQKFLAAILAGFFLIALLRVFSAPFRLALKLLLNTALGFLALWAVRLTAGVTGIALGLNLWNALVIGVLGLPGFFCCCWSSGCCSVHRITPDHFRLHQNRSSPDASPRSRR